MAGYGGQVCLQSWPTYDAAKTVTATTQMAVQVGGKVRANIIVPTDSSDEEVCGCRSGQREDCPHGRGHAAGEVHRGQGTPGQPDF